MTRIVTTTYRYKRPPRKRKAVALDVPAVVPRKRASLPNYGKPKLGLAPPPANDDRKSAIVTTTSRKRLKLLHHAEGPAERDDDPEASAEMRAWLERAKWGPGPSR